MRSLALLPLALLSLAFPASGWAHGEGGEATGFTSTVERVEPETAGLEIRVLDGDDQLLLTNETGSEIVVLGYDGEPYLRFSTDGVYRNVRSPAVYLNADRYARGRIPESADPEAAPVWRLARTGSSYEWHDHRIQWMSTIAPDAVRADPDSPRHVFDWEVPITVGGTPTAVRGSLDYEPVDGGPTAWLYLAVSVPLALALLGWVALRHRLRPEAASP